MLFEIKFKYKYFEPEEDEQEIEDAFTAIFRVLRYTRTETEEGFIREEWLLDNQDFELPDFEGITKVSLSSLDRKWFLLNLTDGDYITDIPVVSVRSVENFPEINYQNEN
jgi:hypothetical protein